MSFSPNDASWEARGAGETLRLDAHGLTVQARGESARVEWVGAAAHALVGEERQTGVINRYFGASKQEGLPTFARLRQPSAWPGIDVIYYGSDGRLEMDFEVQPGARLERVQLRVHGALVVPDGSLRVKTARGEVELRAPVVYQVRDGVRQNVAARFVVHGDRVGFAVGKYDRKRALVIDPVVAYSSYYGGSNDDFAWASAVDDTGALYIAGITASTDLPLPSPSPAPPFNSLAGGADCFVAKVAPGGNTLVYATYIGGAADDQCRAIAVDATHNVFVTGTTLSPNFPLKQAVQGTLGGGTDGFAAMFSPAGTLLYSTYLGGTGFDEGLAIATDGTGAAYIAGDSDGPFPSPSPQTPNSADAWVLKLGARPGDNVSATPIVFVKLIGGSDVDYAQGVAIDASKAVYVTGATSSNDFPLCQNGPCPSPSPATMRPGKLDAFVAKLTAAGDQLVYSRLLGGAEDDSAFAIAVEAGGAAYVAGTTDSTNFPTVNAFQSSFHGTAPDMDSFITKVSANGSMLIYSTYVGGNKDDEATAIAIDSAGTAYLGGSTTSTDFPVTSTAVQSTLPSTMGGAFLLRLNSMGNGLAWGTYFGGSDNISTVLGVSTDGLDNLYAAGFTQATDLTQKNQVTTRHAGQEGFLVKLSPGPEPPIVSFITPSSAPENTNTAVTITGANFANGATVTFDGTACMNVVVVTSETITCTTPQHAAGTVTVTVTNPDNQMSSVPFTFDAPTAPTLTGLTPTSGSVSGGTLVTISGSKIAAGATVTFDGLPATTVSVIDSTRVTATTPAHAAGAVDVVVSNGAGLATTLTAAFTYVVSTGDMPTISTVTPNMGPAAGGTHITVLGNDFVSGASLSIGGAPATGVTVVNATTIQAVTPPGTVGPADVTVSNPNSASFTLTSGFTYGSSNSTLSVVSVVPSTGSTGGGDSVMVLGAGFVSGATVTFGGVAATNVQVVDATQLKVTTPAHAAGAVDVEVATPDGQTAALTNGFTYVAGKGGGCSCDIGGGGGSGGVWWLLLAGLLAPLRRRRRA